jgi:hypothetical protein
MFVNTVRQDYGELLFQFSELKMAPNKAPPGLRVPSSEFSPSEFSPSLVRV